ncbi:MAG: hypothetical protein OXI75_10530 [Rhodospirillales bacterium]|nr:hypothetical protein [Rhodospirillales bacterium]
MPETFTVEKEMATDRREFRRTLRRALSEAQIGEDGDTITVREGDGTLEITLSNDRERGIGLLKLPVLTARFHYSGYDDPAAHLARLDISFQRGGG